MNLPRLAGVISFLAAVVSCVAAAMMVPEVRCALGLPVEPAQACVRRAHVPPPVIATGFQSARGAGAADVEARVGSIRARFQQVESELAAGLYGSSRKELGGVQADSAYLTLYTYGGEVPKVRARVYSGGVRTVWQAYYQGGQLVFIYRTDSRGLGGGWADFGQQRFYFADGRMVRWLAGMEKRAIPAGSAEYVDAEQRMRELGTRMLESARSSDAVATF